MKPDVYIYAHGMFNLSVCVPKDMDRAEVERRCNEERPTGIELRWAISDKPTFAGGEPHPRPCDNDQDRVHYLLHC